MGWIKKIECPKQKITPFLRVYQNLVEAKKNAAKPLTLKLDYDWIDQKFEEFERMAIKEENKQNSRINFKNAETFLKLERNYNMMSANPKLQRKPFKKRNPRLSYSELLRLPAVQKPRDVQNMSKVEENDKLIIKKYI